MEWSRSEQTDSSLSIVSSVELNNTSSTGATIRFVLDFGTDDLSDCGEKLVKIFVAGRPRKLLPYQYSGLYCVGEYGLTLRT